MTYVSPYDDSAEDGGTVQAQASMPYIPPPQPELSRRSTVIAKSSTNTPIDLNRWADPLYARGFTINQIEYFNIRPGTTIFHDPVPGETAKDFEIVDVDPINSTGWIYPIYYPQSDMTVDRIKYYSGKSDGPKVRSPKGFRMPGGKHPPFYVPHLKGLERLKAAIAANHGLLFGVEGEPDNWALDVMGIYNATAFFGWSNVPDSLYASLKWLGVTRFIYITDSDEAGTRGANNVWNALYYTDIAFTIYQTPSTYNGRPTKDTNDILQAIGYDPEQFTKYLNVDLPANFKMEFDKPSRSRYEGFAETKEYLGIYNTPDIARDVIEILNATNKTPIISFDSDGWSNNTQCPATEVPHESDDKKPAFGININSGACNCFKCGNHKIVDIAKKLGLDVNQYRFDRMEPIPPPENMKRLEKVTSDGADSEIGSFFSVAKQRGSSGIDYIHTDPANFVRPRRRVMQDIIKRAEGSFDNYLSFSVPWPMDDPQFVKLGGYCTLLPAGKLVQLISYTGGGKCIVNEYINSEYGQILIADLKPTDVDGISDEDGGTFYPLRIGVITPTGMQYTSHFYDGGIKPVKKIETKHGNTITGTYNHPLMVLNSNGVGSWKILSEINIGDFIATQDKLVFTGTWDEVVVAEDAGMEHVYDLTIPEGHAFVANGIVNHNTTMMRSLEYAFNEIGIHTLLWSPEFDDMEHGDSTVQLVSGVSSIAAMKNDQFYIDKINNLDISEFGTAFEEYERVKTVEAAARVMSLPGESYLATQFSSDVYNLLQMFESICDYALSEGNEIQVVVVDYAQLMQSPHGEKDWDINKSILAFKEWCNLHGEYTSPRDGVKRMRRRKVGIFTSQATKQAARAVQTGEQPYLTPEDAMEVRPDWANLILSTKMGGNFSYSPEWGHSREYEIYVCKNSKGDKREYNEAETGPVKMILNLKNLRIMYKSERLRKQQERQRDKQGASVNNVPASFYPPPVSVVHPDTSGQGMTESVEFKPGYMVDEHGEILPIPAKPNKPKANTEPIDNSYDSSGLSMYD